MYLSEKMLKPASSSKGVVLLIVLGTILIVVVLAAIVLRTVTSQSRLTHHQVSRIKAYYASKGIMNYAQDMLRKGEAAGGWDAGAVTKYACMGDCSGMGVSAYNYTIPTDSDIPFNVLVTIYPQNTALGNTVTQLDIKTQYTYTP